MHTETVCRKPGGSEISDREDENIDTRTPAISQYLLPIRVGSGRNSLSPGSHYKIVDLLWRRDQPVALETCYCVDISYKILG